MQSTRTLLQQQRQPLIRFLGKRHAPAQPSPSPPETPQPHPASPTHNLPESFASYRQKAIQHGPLGPRKSETTSQPPSSGSISYGNATGRSGHSLGSIQAGQGQVFDRSELPARFQVISWSPEEIEAIESGGASVFT